MNYVPVLSTSCCDACGAELRLGDFHPVHWLLCKVCGDDLQANIDADAAEELLSDDAIISALLEVDTDQLIEAAGTAERMLGSRFSEAS